MREVIIIWRALAFVAATAALLVWTAWNLLALAGAIDAPHLYLGATVTVAACAIAFAIGRLMPSGQADRAMPIWVSFTWQMVAGLTGFVGLLVAFYGIGWRGVSIFDFSTLIAGVSIVVPAYAYAITNAFMS